MYQNKFLILFLTLNIVVLSVNCSPVFEPSENIVEDNVTDNTDDPAFEQGDQRANDNFGDMNDFNFETPQRDEENQNTLNQQDGNQSAEQQDDSDGPNGPPQHARERPIGKTAEEEQDSGDGESDEQRGGRGNTDVHKNKQRYQDGEENGSARSLDSFDKDNSFDKESLDDKNEFESNDGETANRQNSAEEQNGQIPPHQIGGPNGIPPLQIDEPILVNGPGGPMPMPLHGRPPMQGRSNSEEDNGGNYLKQTKLNNHKLKNSRPGGAPGSKNLNSNNKYKFLSGNGVKYLHESTGVSRHRVAPAYLASFIADQSVTAESGEEEEQLEPGLREYMSKWLENFKSDPSLLNSLSQSVQNINYGFERK